MLALLLDFEAISVKKLFVERKQQRYPTFRCILEQFFQVFVSSLREPWPLLQIDIQNSDAKKIEHSSVSPMWVASSRQGQYCYILDKCIALHHIIVLKFLRKKKSMQLLLHFK